MSPQSLADALRRLFSPRMKVELNRETGKWDITDIDAKGIKYIVKSVPFGNLGTWVIEDIWKSSPVKQGSAERMNRIIDDLDEELQRKEDKKILDDLEPVTESAWDALQRRQGRTIQNAGMDFVINDKRRFMDHRQDHPASIESEV